MQRVLEGLKVVDMGHVVAGPSAASLLADWGAEVTKIEPLSGEWMRHYRGHMEADPVVEMEGGEVNWLIELLNRGKKGLAVDLRKEQGRAVLHRLVEGADIFLSNYEASTLDKLGLDYDTLSAINPRLIYALLTGFGAVGPDKGARGYDQLLWGRAGLSQAITEPGGNLVIMRPAMLDRITGDHLVMGVLGAVLWREKSGVGQKLDVSLFHSAFWTLGLDIEPALMGLKGKGFDRTESSNPLANVYRTRDDRWMMLAMLESDKDWPSLCAVLERQDLEEDARFSSAQGRAENCRELIAILDQVFMTRDLADWLAGLREHGCIYSPVQTYEEAVTDPQALANDFFFESPHPVAGSLNYVATPVTFSRTPAAVSAPAPAIGEHTEEVLLEAGFSPDDIDALRADDVVV